MSFRATTRTCLRLSALWLALLASAPSALCAEGLYLVRDVDPSGEPKTLGCPPPGFEGPWLGCNTYVGSLPSQLTALGDRLVFAADDGEHGGEPWVSDGTTGGTRLLADVCPGACSSRPLILGRAGGRLLLWADDGARGGELWRTDGTPAGTRRLPEICPGECTGQPSSTSWWFPGRVFEAVELEDKLFFVADAPASGRELWVSDGSAAGTRLVADLAPGATSSLPAGLRRAGDRLYFAAAGAIWRTTAAAETVERVFTWPETPQLSSAVALGDDLIWIARPLDGATGVWLLGEEDGATGALERKLVSFPPQAGLVSPVGVADGGLYFLLNPDGPPVAAARPVEIWFTDGTVAGTRRLHVVDDLLSLSTGPGLPWQGGFLVSGPGRDRQFLRSGLWHVQPAVGRVDLLPEALQGTAVGVARGRLLVSGRQQVEVGGAEVDYFLRHSDGTARGTLEAASFRWSPGMVDSLGPPEVERVGELLFVSRDTPEEGRELWAMPLSALDRTTVHLQGGAFRVRVRFTDHHNGGDQRDAVAVPLRDGTARFWFFRPENPEVVVKVLDGGAVNGKVWVFHGGTTDLEYHVEVLRPLPGPGRQIYSRPAGSLCGDFDTAAFDASTARPAAAPRRSVPVVRAAQEDRCGGDVLCLGADDRFRVRIRFRNQYAGGAEGVGRAVEDSDRAGWFWFFAADKLEVMVKVLDGRAVNGHHWVLWGGLTTVEYELEVSDTTTGVTRTYRHEPGDLCGGADTTAF